MSDEVEQEEEAAEPESTDSAAVQAALAGIPGLSDTVGSRPAPKSGSTQDLLNEPEDDSPVIGTPREPVEDSDTVQQALKQLGLQ